MFQQFDVWNTATCLVCAIMISDYGVIHETDLYNPQGSSAELETQDDGRVKNGLASQIAE
jgi:hypothetical protein